MLKRWIHEFVEMFFFKKSPYSKCSFQDIYFKKREMGVKSGMIWQANKNGKSGAKISTLRKKQIHCNLSFWYRLICKTLFSTKKKIGYKFRIFKNEQKWNGAATGSKKVI